MGPQKASLIMVLPLLSSVTAVILGGQGPGLMRKENPVAPSIQSKNTNARDVDSGTPQSGSFIIKTQEVEDAAKAEASVRTQEVEKKKKAAKADPSYDKGSVPCIGDQLNISKGGTKDSTFRCKGGLCLPLKGRCNGPKNCGDHSDEEGCSEAFPWDHDPTKCRDGAHPNCCGGGSGDPLACAAGYTVLRVPDGTPGATWCSQKYNCCFTCVPGLHLKLNWRIDELQQKIYKLVRYGGQHHIGELQHVTYRLVAMQDLWQYFEDRLTDQDQGLYHQVHEVHQEAADLVFALADTNDSSFKQEVADRTGVLHEKVNALMSQLHHRCH